VSPELSGLERLPSKPSNQWTIATDAHSSRPVERLPRGAISTRPFWGVAATRSACRVPVTLVTTYPSPITSDEIRIVPATQDRWDDVAQLLDAVGEHGCWCQAWRGFDTKQLSAGRSRVELAREQMRRGPPEPGYVAYLDGEPVGWIGFGVREQMGRLVRSRTIPKVDVLPVWSIFCFTVRTGYRRRGIARALLAGLIAYAREQGAPALEAYPVETEGARIHGTAAYVGVASTFETAGFRRVVETDARSDHRPRSLMRLELEPKKRRGRRMPASSS
jgi:GNAT superfamily N-acetyltransferase